MTSENAETFDTHNNIKSRSLQLTNNAISDNIHAKNNSIIKNAESLDAHNDIKSRSLQSNINIISDSDNALNNPIIENAEVINDNKHIKSRSLKLTNNINKGPLKLIKNKDITCRHCHKNFSRVDVLERHIEKSCKKRKLETEQVILRELIKEMECKLQQNNNILNNINNINNISNVNNTQIIICNLLHLVKKI